MGVIMASWDAASYAAYGNPSAYGAPPGAAGYADQYAAYAAAMGQPQQQQMQPQMQQMQQYNFAPPPGMGKRIGEFGERLRMSPLTTTFFYHFLPVHVTSLCARILERFFSTSSTNIKICVSIIMLATVFAPPSNVSRSCYTLNAHIDLTCRAGAPDHFSPNTKRPRGSTSMEI